MTASPKFMAPCWREILEKRTPREITSGQDRVAKLRLCYFMYVINVNPRPSEWSFVLATLVM